MQTIFFVRERLFRWGETFSLGREIKPDPIHKRKREQKCSLQRWTRSFHDVLASVDVVCSFAHVGSGFHRHDFEYGNRSGVMCADLSPKKFSFLHVPRGESRLNVKFVSLGSVGSFPQYFGKERRRRRACASFN